MTTTDPDVVSYLRQTLAEVRARAEAAEQSSYSYAEAIASITDGGTDAGLEAHHTHAELLDPATVLRMVAATERLLELHFPTYDRTACTLCGWGEGDGSPEAGYWPCPTLQAVASGWGWKE